MPRGVGNPNIGKVTVRGAAAVVPPRQLADMRRVYETDDPENDTVAQRPLRLMKMDDYEKFLKLLGQAERDFKEEVRKNRADKRLAVKQGRELKLKVREVEGPPAGGKAVADAGTMAALELIEKLLREVK